MSTPLWTTLRPVGNSSAARLTILLPLIGYFIVFNDGFSHSQLAKLIVEIEGKKPDNLGLSVSPRLFQIYFGLCFVAVASALYAWACPVVVKRHSSAGEYLSAEGVHLGEYATRDLEVKLAQTNDDFDQFRIRIQNRIGEDYSPQEAGAEVKNATLTTHFETENSKLWWVRASIALLYLTGFLILLVPALKIFSRVCAVLYGLLAEHGLSAIW